MTQMVLSRGHVLAPSLPDTPPSLRSGSPQRLNANNEDVMVMDTKLKIIEVLQVRQRPLWSGAVLF